MHAGLNASSPDSQATLFIKCVHKVGQSLFFQNRQTHDFPTDIKRTAVEVFI